MSKSALADEKPVTLPIAPVMKGKEMLVPVRMIDEYFHYRPTGQFSMT